MNLEFIMDMYIPVVMIACLVLGFILKKWYPLDNKWIPTILVAVGAVLGCVANGGIILDGVVAGAVTGLASTGLHQAFKQLLKLDAPESTEQSCVDRETVESLIQADMAAAAKENPEAVETDQAEG
ncbi:MAG: hypothetical protein HFE75_04470 [Firmicutes bacterium]|jgi:hypothetical protein|nr:hypothetical protein [Bacillota bacterium]